MHLMTALNSSCFIWQHRKKTFVTNINGRRGLLIASAQRQQDLLVVALGVVLKGTERVIRPAKEMEDVSTVAGYKTNECKLWQEKNKTKKKALQLFYLFPSSLLLF